VTSAKRPTLSDEGVERLCRRIEAFDRIGAFDYIDVVSDEVRELIAERYAQTKSHIVAMRVSEIRHNCAAILLCSDLEGVGQGRRSGRCANGTILARVEQSALTT
jgi:hypothetical protein